MEVCQNFTDRSCAFKGKRTRRSRPSSPLDTAGTTTVTTISSIPGGSDDGGGSRGDLYNSPTTSTTQISTNSTSEEDEDMANCLILLAQSGCGQKVEDVTEVKKEKISSRKFAEMTTSTTGKAGFYVYECKTCNRTFPSFQALGGHRASHKKPKSVTVNTTAATDTTNTAVEFHDHQEQEQGRLNKISSSHSNQIFNSNSNNNKTKIHECSICGSEFSSGQALGGHMRRHRPPTTTTTTTTTTTNTKISTNIETISYVSESSSSHDEKSTRNILSLDLNLPAPLEDDHKFEQSIVFSAAPLVDCYY
ncbi:hypothetical protein HAX54_041026 [Datura stramonium]|uniref:C2H2-type domain-containing protein n=1 Tax=Datura stramonium TaxID=4076 RepID=A0ABS8VSD6_DATST|nr:hypothetical protein [Datura stramonium]